MAGILPIAIKDKKVFFLFGRETVDQVFRDAGKWSDFGGSIEKGEKLEDVAIREGWEETSGILGNQKTVKELVEKKTIQKITNGTYTTFLVAIDYNNKLPSIFDKTYKNIKKNKPELIQEHNGLYEKDKIKWIEVDNLHKHKKIFRPWYLSILNKAITYGKSLKNT
jgi:8-oxo-dGTP pyrophosphatase MutT (NUDIX family)